jgi:hypothetical protein
MYLESPCVDLTVSGAGGGDSFIPLRGLIPTSDLMHWKPAAITKALNSIIILGIYSFKSYGIKTKYKAQHLGCGPDGHNLTWAKNFISPSPNP